MRIRRRLVVVLLGVLAGASGCTKIVTKRLESNAICEPSACADGGLDGSVTDDAGEDTDGGS